MEEEENMNNYIVYLISGDIVKVRADSWELIESKEYKFYKKNGDEIRIVALFNFENICGVVREGVEV